MCDRTALQENIISELEEDTSKSNEQIADSLECSESYVRRMRSRYLPEYYGQNDLLNAQIELSFSSPYSIQMTEEIAEEFGIDDSNIVRTTFETGQDEIQSFVCKLGSFDDVDLTEEVKSFTYALEQLGSELPESLEEPFLPFLEETSDDLNIYSSDMFEDFINITDSWLGKKIEDADILIGVQLFRTCINENVDTEDSVRTPVFEASTQSFKDIYSHESAPRLIDVEHYAGEITTPDKVYFTYSGNLDDSYPENTIDYIRGIQYMDPNAEFKFGRRFKISGPKGIGTSNENVLELTDDNICLTELKTGFVFVPHGGSIDDTVVDDITDDLQMSVPGFDTTIEIEKNLAASRNSTKFIRLSFDNVTITLQVDNRYIAWSYPDIEFVQKTVSRLNELILDELGIEEDLNHLQNTTLPEEIKHLVFDTNAVYHEIVDDEPSSILRSFFPMEDYNFFESNIIIPWPTRYEINKHKDVGGPGQRVQENGIDNLFTLKILDEFDFIDIDVHNVPKNMTAQITESHVADMALLESAEDVENAALVTGDERLRELARVSDTTAMNIYELAQVETSPNLDDLLDEKVFSRIGNELLTSEDIIGEINSLPENNPTDIRKGIDSIENPNEYLTEWIETGQVIQFYNNDSDRIEYKKSIKEDIVISPTAATLLVENIVEDDRDNKLLTMQCLEQLRKRLKLPKNKFPTITFHVPVSNVIAPQMTSLGGISTEARNFYKLSQLSNADYSTDRLKDSSGNDEYVHDSVLLASEKSYPMLYTENEEFLSKVAGLLAIDVVKFE